MREEISEPQQWRSHARGKTATTGYWGSRRQSVGQGTDVITSMPLEAVDAVFAEELIRVEPVSGSRRDLVSQEPTGSAVSEQMQSSEGNDLLQNLSAQLAMLKTQQEHLQDLLAQDQDVRG